MNSFMVNSVAQQLELINILIGQALTTLLWVLGYSAYRITFDIFGKHCDRVIPEIRRHNPITMCSIRKSLINSQFKRKLNRQNRNRVLLASRTPRIELVPSLFSHDVLSDATVTDSAALHSFMPRNSFSSPVVAAT